MSDKAHSGAVGHGLGSTSTAEELNNNEEGGKPGKSGVGGAGAGGGDDSKGTSRPVLSYHR